MAGHLLDAGYPLAVYNRSKEKAEGLLEKGAQWRESPKAAASDAEIVISMVGYPADVEAIYLGESGILANLPRGGLAIDMTTSSPLVAQSLAEIGAKRGIGVLDAPVSGGDVGAREARLSIMVGGRGEDFERARHLFDLMGAKVALQGGAGAGQHAKMCNQIAIAGGMVAIGESLAYAKRAGLDPETLLESIASGAAGSWSMSNLAPRALQGDYAPGFYVKHFIKDMKIALEAADQMGLSLPSLSHAKALYERLAAEGGAEDGTQALFRLYLER